MEEPTNLGVGVDSVSPEDILILVDNINNALIQGDEIALEDTLKMVVTNEQTRCFVRYSPLIFENVGVIPVDYSPKEIILTYENGNIPVFYKDGNYSHRFGLSGEECWIVGVNCLF